MDFLQHSSTAIAIFIGSGVLAGNIWYGIKSRSNKLLKEDIAELNEKLDKCEVKHVANEKRIVELEARINHTINIPLNQIAKHIEKSNKHQQKTNEALQQLLGVLK